MTAPTVFTRDLGPAPEPVIARDLLRRALPVAPILVFLAALPWGADGALSAAFAVAIVLVNFLLAAWLLATTARISLGLMMGTALFGYVLRLGLIFAAVWLVKDAGWVHELALGLTLIVTHLGLLFWEMRYVSASLAHPALKPPAPKPPATRKETSSP